MPNPFDDPDGTFLVLILERRPFADPVVIEPTVPAPQPESSGVAT